MSRTYSLELSAILSSEARFCVLQTLARMPFGLKLREMERATGLSIRSVQVATEGLLQERIILKNPSGTFKFNPRSQIATKIRKLFHFLRDEELREKAEALSDRAKQVIQLSEEVIQFVSQARSRG